MDDAVSYRPHRKPILTICSLLGYWCNLWSNLDFADKPLKDCVNLIHTDIVNIWDPDNKNKVSCFGCPYFLTVQRNQYISSKQFKINISHIVKDLGVTAAGASPR